MIFDEEKDKIITADEILDVVRHLQEIIGQVYNTSVDMILKTDNKIYTSLTKEDCSSALVVIWWEKNDLRIWPFARNFKCDMIDRRWPNDYTEMEILITEPIQYGQSIKEYMRQNFYHRPVQYLTEYD